jgi:uncharacterized damage-inducible protein DinB
MANLPNHHPDVMAQIETRWAEFQRLLAGQSPAQLEAPLSDSWSTKVHLGHVTAWERSLLALLRGQDGEAAMGVPEELAARHNIDEINRFVAGQTDSMPLAEVRREADAVHAELMTFLESMSDADLAEPCSHYQPNDPPYNAKPVIGWIAGNAWEHYEEHIGWIKASLGTA